MGKQSWRRRVTGDAVTLVGQRAWAGRIQRPLGVGFAVAGFLVILSAKGHVWNVATILSGIAIGIMGFILLVMEVPLNTVRVSNTGIVMKKGSGIDLMMRWIDVIMVQKGRDWNGRSTIALIRPYRTHVVREGPDLNRSQIERLFRAIVEKTQMYPHVVIDDFGILMRAGTRIR
jgi:hypothetical protein